MEPEKGVDKATEKGIAWGAIASLVGILLWAVFLTAFALWWSLGLTLFQNLVVLVASLDVTAVAIGIMWMGYGMRHGWLIEGHRLA